jgi:hypothetical protein
MAVTTINAEGAGKSLKKALAHAASPALNVVANSPD